ncbi:hypothetical protein E2C01_090783 [Portunus trituberculatus]|uniref:Uncharacterized protein n=1 Tax=Portunus trituberculatus TaxID=210409 RepID=A0A5B7JLS8_PORTR|nr:hypothetical protein [Portunus trituberculatus]
MSAQCPPSLRDRNGYPPQVRGLSPCVTDCSTPPLSVLLVLCGHDRPILLVRGLYPRVPSLPGKTGVAITITSPRQIPDPLPPCSGDRLSALEGRRKGRRRGEEEGERSAAWRIIDITPSHQLRRCSVAASEVKHDHSPTLPANDDVTPVTTPRYPITLMTDR